MTRETRIAMLVGLLFIIMFGLVLSELTKAQPAAAPLTARSEPGLAHRYTAVVEPAPGGDTPATAADGGARPPAELARDTHDPCSIVDVRVWRTVPDKIDDPIASGDTSRRIEEVHEDPAPAPTATPTPAPAGPAGKKYLVKAKDTLLKIARAEYGPQNEQQYTLIAKANPGVDPLRLRTGQEIIIPPLPAAAPPGDRTPPGRTPAPPAPTVRDMTPDELATRFGVGRTPAPDRTPVVDPRLPGHGTPPDRVPVVDGPLPETGKKYYFVQKGDSLGKIARDQLKSASHASILKLVKVNKLKDPDDIRVGMRLEIPS